VSDEAREVAVKGDSGTKVQSAYSQATSLEEQLRQAGFPSSPREFSIVCNVRLQRLRDQIILHFLRRLRHGRHPVRDRRLLSGSCLMTGIAESLVPHRFED
jgi:hypothetical protein